MKTLQEAIDRLGSGCPEGVARLLASAMRKHCRLMASHEAAISMLEKIRYQNWPTLGLGIGLYPHEMDEILIEAEAAFNACRRK